jgi:hypothetical protein
MAPWLSLSARFGGPIAVLTLGLALPRVATADVIVPSGATWQYTFCDPTADAAWNTTVGLGGLGGQCGWLDGPAPFSNVEGNDPFAYDTRNGTYWPDNTADYSGPYVDDLWVRLALDLTDYDLTTVFWQMAVDNGYKMYLNGTLLGSDNQEGYTWAWEYSGAFPNATQGLNILALALEDHGVRTAFDMEITGTPIPAPEPATMTLVGLGGLALAARRRRKRS